MDRSTANTPYWILIIRYYLRKGYVRNGPTLPYLIGGRLVVEPQLPLLSIQEWVTQAVEYSSGITIMQCDNIGEYVLGELDSESRKQRQIYQHIGHLYVTDDSLGCSSNVTQLAAHFTELYAECIGQRKYSKVGGLWEPFSVIDRQWLQEVVDNK